MIKNNKKGFTLAEILITLTVIGIVAAISLPALVQNINERTWDAKRKALHVRLSNAILDMPKIRGFGEYKQETVEGSTVTTDTEAESFLVDGLSKVYKLKNVCISTNLDKCGLPKTFTNLQGSSVTLPTTGFSRAAAGFETENGEKVAVYYNSACRPLRSTTDTSITAANGICVNFIYDLNGMDEPNTIGKDMGVMSAIYGPNGLEVVSPNLYRATVGSAPFYAEDGNDAASLCKSKNPKYTLPSITEAMSVTYNNLSTGHGGNKLSGTVDSAGKNGMVWYAANYGTAGKTAKTTSMYVMCIKE